MDNKQAIAIVGIGGIFPGANDLNEFWENILAARDCSREPPKDRWLLSVDDVYDPNGPQPDKVYSKRACFVEDFQFDKTGLDIADDLLASLDPVFHLLLYAGKQAWQDAITKNLRRERVGVVIGNIVLPTDSSSAIADELLLPVFEQQITGKTSAVRATNKLNRYVAGLPAGVLARALGLGGGSYTLDAACASSLYSLKYARDELQAGRADAMLCGGLSRPDSLYTQMGFSALHAISATGRCAPFDHKGDGLVVGEGAGILMLKRLDDALAAGDRIYATVAGAGLSNDIGGNLMLPDSEGQARAMQAAYAEARWQPGAVDLIECHGTGTPVGDVVEFNSLQALWNGQRNKQDCVIGSVKSNIGHLLTAAGAAGLIKVLLSMQDAKLPPTANFDSPAKNIDLHNSPFTVLQAPWQWQQRDALTPRRAAVSAFGFGGINAHVLLEQWNERPEFVPAPKSQKKSSVAAGDVAIVGMDACFGQWSSLKSFRARIFGDADVQAEISNKTWGLHTQVNTHRIDKVAIPVGRFRIPPHELKDMLPQQLLMLQTAANALEDADIKGAKEAMLSQAGVYVGIGLDLNTTNFHVRWGLLNKAREWARALGLTLNEEELAAWVNELRDACGPHLNANRTMGALGGIVASRIARAFNIGGAGFTLSNEECSGLRALSAGVRALQGGEINLAIVGAVDLAGDIRAVSGLAASASIGEGAAALVLKPYANAVRDGDRIYSRIKGLGESSGGASNDLNPDSNAYQSAVRRCLADAKVDLASIAFIETQAGKEMETQDAQAEAISLLYQNVQKEIPVALGNVQADIGHAGAASGLASLVKASLCLYHQTLPAFGDGQELPALLKHKQLSVFAPRQTQYWLRNRQEGPRRALVNSSGIGGNCISAILEESGSGTVSSALSEHDAAVLFSVCADNKDELLLAIQSLQQFARQSSSPTMAGLPVNGGKITLPGSARHWL